MKILLNLEKKLQIVSSNNMRVVPSVTILVHDSASPLVARPSSFASSMPGIYSLFVTNY